MRYNGCAARMWWNGIHYRLKICRPYGLAGSNPAIRTKQRGCRTEDNVCGSPVLYSIGVFMIPS